MFTICSFFSVFFINPFVGRGQCDQKCDSASNFHAPLEVFKVQKGKRYRFRVVSNAYLNCPFIVSVQSHKMLLIASDGAPVEPFPVSTFMIHAGERYDFILEANQTVNNYYLTVQGMIDCGKDFLKTRQAAVIHYDTAPTYDFNQQIPSYESMNVDGVVSVIRVFLLL